MHRPALAAPALLIVVAAARPAAAAQTDPQDVTFTYSGTMLSLFDYDTGWWPSSSADIRVRFGAAFDGDVESEVGAEHWISWPEAVDFHVSGVDHEGWILVDYGLDLTMKVAYDLGVLGSGTYDVPIDDYLEGITNVVAFAEFTPLLLQGHGERPVHFEQEHSEWTLVDASIPLATGVALELRLLLRPTLECFFQGEEVAVDDAAAVTDEGVAVHVPWTTAWETGVPGNAVVPIQYVGRVDCSFNLTVVPIVAVCIGTCFDMELVEIPIPVQDENKLLKYDVEDAEYNVPVLQVDDSPIDFGHVLVGREAHVDLPVWNPGGRMMEVEFTVDPALGDFTAFPSASLLVPPGEGREVRLSFAPSTWGHQGATLSIESDAPFSPADTVALTGTGVLDPLEADPVYEEVTAIEEPAETAACGCNLVGGSERNGTSGPIALFALSALAAIALGRRRPPRRGVRSQR